MPFRVSNTTRGKLLADRAEQATGFLARLVGLMGRRHLDFGEGLHLVPCNSIHTFFMRIPIDALFLDSKGAVVKAYPALPPWRVTGIFLRARSVLELPAGTMAGSGTREGDQLLFERATR
ncbi:MAG: DUF192 domain-containing protein [Myxococcales bacterium]|nr:DUF192 domain-containing protein [Myxococcales bacterium]